MSTCLRGDITLNCSLKGEKIPMRAVLQKQEESEPTRMDHKWNVYKKGVGLTMVFGVRNVSCSKTWRCLLLWFRFRQACGRMHKIIRMAIFFFPGFQECQVFHIPLQEVGVEETFKRIDWNLCVEGLHIVSHSQCFLPFVYLCATLKFWCLNWKGSIWACPPRCHPWKFELALFFRGESYSYQSFEHYPFCSFSYTLVLLSKNCDGFCELIVVVYTHACTRVCLDQESTVINLLHLLHTDPGFEPANESRTG